MVYEDVKLDVNGIPEKLPGLYYLRLPLTKTEPNTYEDWKRRKGSLRRLLEGTNFEIERIALEVDRIEWERKIRTRSPISQEEFEINERIVRILEGKKRSRYR